MWAPGVFGPYFENYCYFTSKHHYLLLVSCTAKKYQFFIFLLSFWDLEDQSVIKISPSLM